MTVKKWRSRTWQVLTVTLTMVLLISGVALFVDKATFAEWSGFVQWFVPAMYAIAKGGSTADKYIWTKHAPKEGPRDD